MGPASWGPAGESKRAGPGANGNGAGDLCTGTWAEVCCASELAVPKPQASCTLQGTGWSRGQGGGGGRTVRCAKRRLFSTAGSHGSQGPEVCTPEAVLNGSCMFV